MSDIQLDINGDIDITDDSMSLTFDDVEAVKQRLSIRLKAFRGEYFLDLGFGVPYFQQVFIKGISQGVIDAVFKNQINDTPGVAQVTSYSSTLIASSRDYSASFKALLDSGETIEGTV